MQIIKAHDQYGWITAIIDGRWVQAKVYNEPSTYGVNNGRVSKLAIGKTEKWNPQENFFDQMCYNYDRGLDFSRIPRGLLNSIVKQLDALPLLDLE